MNVVAKETLEAEQQEEGAYLKGAQGVLPIMAYKGYGNLSLWPVTGPKKANRRCEKKTRKLSGLSTYSYLKGIKVMLHGTIRNDDF